MANKKQEKMERMPSRLWFIVPVIVLTALAAILVGVFTHPLIGVGILIGGIGAFVLQGLVNIPADPPYRGIPTFKGKRYPKILEEGWQFLPLYNVPYVGYGVVLVKIEKINFDLKEEDVRAPDLAEIRIPVSVTFQPDYKTRKGLIDYENTGGESGVINILSDIIRQELREWAVNFKRTKVNEAGMPVIDEAGKEIKELGEWSDVVKAQDEAVAILINAVTGARKELTSRDITRIRRGDGAERHPGLGIIINRLNVGEIKALGDLAKAAEKVAKEVAEVAGEKKELDFVGGQIGQLTDAGLTPVEARRTIQVAQGKISETVKTNVIGITPETFEAAGEAIARALGRGEDQSRRQGRRQRRRRPRQGGGEQ